MKAFDDKFYNEHDYVTLVAESLGQDYKTVYKFMWDEHERREKSRNMKIFLVYSGRPRRIFQIEKSQI